MHIQPISVYIEARSGSFYIATHANGAILQTFKDIEIASKFLIQFKELFHVTNVAYRNDTEALVNLMERGVPIH